MTTMVHFENKPIKQSLQMNVATQLARINNDEEIAAREYENKLYERQQLRSAWMEQLDGLAMEKKAMIDRLKVKEEFHLAKRALIQVRQHMLKKFLEDEMEVYKQELAKMGKAIYVNRM
ncbi:uncharacterized protein LOC134844000 isoform X5 [Symsagittifera roscoffensis]|uniref:uncharacterized protein LOC134844000 isoform X4 n=1 Tax=Symsagittifera roscoffensis TaxID=84072 RepID=UPI00307CBCD9